MVKTKKSEGVFGLKKCRNMREMGLKFVLRVLGLLLLTAAVMKGHELLTTPMANTDIWSNRYFLIFQVEFELALGIWLLSGLFRRAAWLVVLGCFTLFCCVTLYKGLTGAASCGCFGRIHVNPWITLFAIDLPAVLALLLFRPKLETQKVLDIMHWLQPRPCLTSIIISLQRQLFLPFDNNSYSITRSS
jgi:hypothetical protein